MIFSKTFYASGTFDGTDQLPLVIEPWEDVAIEIVCVDITFFQFDSRFVNYAFAGNGFSPDIMRWWGEPNPIPPGEFFPCPAKGGFTPTTETHLDLHVSGQLGQKWQGYYTVYYRKVASGAWDGQDQLG